jgi:hypothetical protein
MKSKIIKTSILFFVIAIIAPITTHAENALNFMNETFNSHGDFVYCGQPTFGFTDKLTISVWIKWTTDPKSWAVSNHQEREGSYSTYIAYATHNTYNTSTEHGQFWLRNSKNQGKIVFAVENATGTIASVTSSTAPSSGTWYHVAGTYDGSNLKLYINGIQEGGNVSLTGNIRANTDCRLTMGKLPWGYGLYVGYLDEVRIWNVALSQAEIQSQMNSKATVRDADCKSYWNFDAGSGTVITDSKGLASGTFYTALVDVHSYTATPTTVSDNDRAFVTNAWNGKTMKTVAGAGVDETNSIISNTGNVFTLSAACATTPVYDGTANMTWFGVLDAMETAQWVSSEDIPLPITLSDFSARLGSSGVELTWTTASEQENAAFHIYRNEELIATIEGAGTSTSIHDYSFIDKYIVPGMTYTYVLADVNYANEETRHRDKAVTIIVPENIINNSFSLLGNYPNPFNPVTTIAYDILNNDQTDEAFVELSIYDVNGNKIATIVNEYQQSGYHEAYWNASGYGSGIYISRLSVGNQSKTHKLVLIK